MTGQAILDSYGDAGVIAAVDLVNELAPRGAKGGERAPEGSRAALAKILAKDPPSVAQLRDRDVPAFRAVAHDLRQVFTDLGRGDLDKAASRVNGLLARYPAHPHLAKEGGRWRLHHHPMNVALVPMWAASCAEGLARMIGAGCGDRLGTCDAPECGRVFFDASRNASRRFCSTTCQNRVKAAAFRLRQGRRPPRSLRRTPKR